MNWSAQGLTTVDKERIWKEYVGRESEKRVIYDEYRQRATEKSREPEVKISPRGKRFMAKEPYGIQMVMNAEGRMTPVLTDKVTLAGQQRAQQSVGASLSSTNSGMLTSPTNQQRTSGAGTPTSPIGTVVRLPAIQLSSTAIQQQVDADNNTHKLTSPLSSHRGHTTSPRKFDKNASALQQQYLQNNFSSCGSPAHGSGKSPDAELDRSLKNLQFLTTTSGTIGRGTIELLQGVPVNGCSRSGAQNTPTHGGRVGEDSGNATFNGSNTDFGTGASGALRTALTNNGKTSPIRQRNEYIPGSPRSYVVKDPQGGALFEHGKKECDITKSRTELTLRK